MSVEWPPHNPPPYAFVLGVWCALQTLAPALASGGLWRRQHRSPNRSTHVGSAAPHASTAPRPHAAGGLGPMSGPPLCKEATCVLFGSPHVHDSDSSDPRSVHLTHTARRRFHRRLAARSTRAQAHGSVNIPSNASDRAVSAGRDSAGTASASESVSSVGKAPGASPPPAPTPTPLASPPPSAHPRPPLLPTRAPSRSPPPSLSSLPPRLSRSAAVTTAGSVRAQRAAAVASTTTSTPPAPTRQLLSPPARPAATSAGAGAPARAPSATASTPPLPASSAAAHTAATPVPARGTPAAAVDEKAAVAAIDPPWFQPLCVEARKRAQDTAFEIYSSVSDGDSESIVSEVRQLRSADPVIAAIARKRVDKMWRDLCASITDKHTHAVTGKLDPALLRARPSPRSFDTSALGHILICQHLAAILLQPLFQSSPVDAITCDLLSVPSLPGACQ